MGQSVAYGTLLNSCSYNTFVIMGRESLDSNLLHIGGHDVYGTHTLPHPF